MPRLLRLDVVASTMEPAHRLAQQGEPTGSAGVARSQLAGRGRQNKTWQSGAGGLWLSVIVRPSANPALDVLGLRVGLAVAHAIESVAEEVGTIGLKWPNDLHLQGCKFGGILCEARWNGERCQWVVVGVGLNVGNQIDSSLPNAVRLVERWPQITPGQLEQPVIDAIVAAASHTGTLTDHELDAWDQRDVLRGRLIETPRPGVADGIDATGALLIRDEMGIIHPCRLGVATLTD